MPDNTTNSILASVKKLLGIIDGDTSFDPDIIIHINTVLSNLVQMGVGNDLIITGNGETWDQFIPSESKEKFQQIKSYVYLKVKLLFDTPANSTMYQSITEHLKELEYRLYTEAGGY